MAGTMPFTGDRTCPVCREPLVACRLHGIEIDGCPSCRGTWLDAGELELLSEIAGVGPGVLRSALGRAAGVRRTPLRCPRCWRRLEAVSVGREPIELDRCRGGHGLWLDRGETEELIRTHSDSEEEAVAEFFAELYRDRLASDRDN